MNRTGWQDYRVTLTAGLPVRLAVSGDYVKIQTAAAPVRLAFDGGEYIEREQTQGDPFRYESEVRLLSEVDQTVVVSLGYAVNAPPFDGRASVTGTVNAIVDKVTVRPTYPDVAIPAGTQVMVAAADPDRLSLLVQLPDDAAGNVRVGDNATAANQGVILYPGDAVLVSGAPAVYVFNTADSPVTVALIAERAP